MAFSQAWQFALGARWSSCCPDFRQRPKAIGALGLLMIVSSALLLDPKMSYPGLWALLPSLGAALVLHSGSGHSGLGMFVSPSHAGAWAGFPIPGICGIGPSSCWARR